MVINRMSQQVARFVAESKLQYAQYAGLGRGLFCVDEFISAGVKRDIRR